MNIFLTGSKGFIGSALLRPLLMEGKYRVICSQGRLSPNTDWLSELQGVDVIIHCAARVHVMRESALDPLAEFRRVNVAGTATLAKQAALCGVKRFIFLSSIKVNGEATRPGEAFRTDDTPAPLDAYGQSKWEAELALQSIARDSGMEVTIIRPPLVYGPGVKGNFALLVKLVAKGLPLPLGSIHNARSLVAIDNLVDLICTTLSSPAAANQTFLVSDNADISTPDLLRNLAHAMHIRPRLFPFPPRLLEVGAKLLGKEAMAQRLCSNLQADISKTMRILDWKPPISLGEGLRRAVWVA